MLSITFWVIITHIQARIWEEDNTNAHFILNKKNVLDISII